MEGGRLYAGLLAPLVSLSGIGAAVILNRSWWGLTDNAISDMGRVGLQYNWVLNSALIIAAVLGIYYTSGLLVELKNPVQRLGLGVFIVGLLFLAAIGLFPGGTAPHYPASWGFFVAASAGMLVVGLGFYIEGDKWLGAFMAALAMRTFKGVAIPEFIGIFAIIIWHYAVFLRLRRADG